MPEPLNICIMQTHLPSERLKSGGEERFTKELAERLSRKHRVFVLTKGDKSRTVTRGNLTIKYIRCTGIRYVRFLVYVFLLVREALKIRKMDILQVHVSDRTNGLAGVLVSRMRKLCLITRVSGFDPIPTLNFIQRWFLITIFRRSDLIVSINSDFMEREIRYICPESSVVVLPHGIDLEAREKPKKMPSGPRKNLLFVGRLIFYKNVEMLCVTMKEVLKKYEDARLTIIGSGPDEDKVKSCIKDAGLERSIILKGDMPHDEVMRHMRKADLFVFPSQHEPRGLVLIEAMSTGLPIVAFGTGGPKDIIKDRRNGLVVGVGSGKGIRAGFGVSHESYRRLAGKVIEVLGNRALYESISKKNILDVKEYSWERVIRKWENAYLRALKA
jgi:glycosyltransferase involved in cell wall biosynthesis